MMSSNWVKNAINEINADHQRSADTHLIRLPLSAFPGIQLYLKDESTHPTGSLKHRLARSLFLYGLCNGWIKEGTPIIEASSGSTAISEAWSSAGISWPVNQPLSLNTCILARVSQAWCITVSAT